MALGNVHECVLIIHVLIEFVLIEWNPDGVPCPVPSPWLHSLRLCLVLPART